MRLVRDPSMLLIVVIPWAPAVILSKLAFLTRPQKGDKKPTQPKEKE